MNTADEQTATPIQEMIKGFRDNLKGLVSDVQSRRMSMLGTRERGTRSVLKKDGLMKRKGIASDGQGMVAKVIAMIPRPLGLLKPPAPAGGNGADSGADTGGTTTDTTTETDREPTTGARRLTGH